MIDKQRIFRLSIIIPITLLIVWPLFFYAYRRYFILHSPDEGFYVGIAIAFVLIIEILTYKLILNAFRQKKKIKIYLKGIYGIFSLIALVGIIVGAWNINFYFAANNYSTGPILIWGEGQDPQTEITIMWRTSDNTTSTINYGTDKSNLDKKAENLLDTVNWHQIGLSGLTPNTQYYYQIEGFGKEEIFNFKTAPSENTAFSFYFVSDMRQNNAPLTVMIQKNVPRIMAEVARENELNLAFTITGGDTTCEGDNEPLWKSWFDDISKLSGLGSYAPVQPSIGNHERHDDWDATYFQDFYPIEDKPQFYYSYNYSSLHVQILDPWNKTSRNWGALDATQLAWAEEDLNKSYNMPYRIISLHPPPVYNGEVNPNLEPLVKLCEKYDVDAVFFGHHHSFEVSNINGTYFYLAGVGGALTQSGTGFIQVDVSPTQMSCMVHWVNGTSDNIGTMLPS